MKRFILIFCIVVCFTGCDKTYELDKNDVKQWENNDLIALNECCQNFNKLINSLLLNNFFSKDLRYRYLTELNLSGIIIIYEHYMNDERSTIIVYNGKKSVLIDYYYMDDQFKVIDKDFEMNPKQMLNDYLKAEDIDDECCNIQRKPPSTEIYSTIKIEKGRLTVLESYYV